MFRKNLKEKGDSCSDKAARLDGAKIEPDSYEKNGDGNEAAHQGAPQTAARESGAGMEEFLDEICSHIKYTAVRRDIRSEIEGHILELKQEYEEQGASPDEAEEKAVLAMGDGGEIGRRLNKLHRPRMDWTLFAVVTVLACVGIVNMFFLSRHGYNVSFIKYVFCAAAGFAVMLGLSMFSYERLKKITYPLYAFSLIALFATALFGTKFNGASMYVSIGGFAISPDYAIVFLAVAFAGFFMKYRGCGIAGELKLTALLVLALIPVMIMPCARIAAVLAVAFWIVLIASASMGHFGENRRRHIGVALTIAIAVSIAAAFYICLNPRLLERIYAFVSRGQSDLAGAGYIEETIGFWLSGAEWIGRSEVLYNGYGIEQSLPSAVSDYALVNLVVSFGWIAGAMFTALAAALIVRGFVSAAKIKNRYGFLLSTFACSALAVQFITGIFVNFGLVPQTSVSIPFISYGGTGYIVNMALTGLILSVWRRNRIVSEAEDEQNSHMRDVGIVYLQDGKVIFDLSRLIGKKK